MATQTVNARFTNGALMPLEPLDLPEGVLVELNIQTLDATGPDTPADAAAKTEFRVVPNQSGLAPGVTTDNLKDIINEMEDEYLLRKLGL